MALHDSIITRHTEREPDSPRRLFLGFSSIRSLVGTETGSVLCVLYIGLLNSYLNEK